MAQIAAGQLRSALRFGSRLITWSEPVNYDQVDNNAAPLTYVPDTTGQGRKYGTINDYYWNAGEFAVIGSAGHILEIQFYDTSAHATINTASHVMNLRVAESYVNPLTKKPEITDRLLSIADRVTKDTAGTYTDPDGLKDSQATIANEWMPVARFKPAYGRNWKMRGLQRIVVDGV